MNSFFLMRMKNRLIQLLIPLIVFQSVNCKDAGDEKKVSRIYPDGIVKQTDGSMLITRHGITWHFNHEYQYGTFANGDYWIIGPVTIIGIYPESRYRKGRTMNGSMINPSPLLDVNHIYHQGYDSHCGYMIYDPALNAALGVSPDNPLIIQNGSSLISSVSRPEPDVNPQVKAASVLTVVGEAPDVGSFRPAFSGNDKTIKYTKNQLRYNLLGRIEPVASTPKLSTVEDMFSRVWLNHVTGWTNGAINPAENMPWYGNHMAGQIGIASLMLSLNFTDEEKETLLIRLVQVGIDAYRNMQLGLPGWPGAGGHGQGMKWPILFAGIMLDDADMQAIGQKSGNYINSAPYGPGNEPPDYIVFGEDEQVFYVTQKEVDITSGSDWRPDERNGKGIPYNVTDIGMPEWGKTHSSDPYQDNRDWNAIYRQCCGAVGWSGFILTARIMKVRHLWNHDALFDYQDRYMAVTAPAESNPAWRTAINENISAAWSAKIQTWWGTNADWRASSLFCEEMWDTYRSLY